MKTLRYLLLGALALAHVSCEGLTLAVDSKGRVVAEYQLPPKAVKAEK